MSQLNCSMCRNVVDTQQHHSRKIHYGYVHTLVCIKGHRTVEWRKEGEA